MMLPHPLASDCLTNLDIREYADDAVFLIAAGFEDLGNSKSGLMIGKYDVVNDTCERFQDGIPNISLMLCRMELKTQFLALSLIQSSKWC